MPEELGDGEELGDEEFLGEEGEEGEEGGEESVGGMSYHAEEIEVVDTPNDKLKRISCVDLMATSDSYRNNTKKEELMLECVAPPSRARTPPSPRLDRPPARRWGRAR